MSLSFVFEILYFYPDRERGNCKRNQLLTSPPLTQQGSEIKRQHLRRTASNVKAPHCQNWSGAYFLLTTNSKYKKKIMTNSKYKKFFFKSNSKYKKFLRPILSTKVCWLQILSTKRVWWQIQSTKSFWWCWDRGMGCTFLKLGIVPDNCAEHTRICQLFFSAKKNLFKDAKLYFFTLFALD